MTDHHGGTPYEDGDIAPEQLRRVLVAAPDGVVVVDRHGVIRFWNAGAERIFGRSAAEALGQRLDLIIPERHRDRHWEAFDRAVAEGRSRYGPTDLLSVPAIGPGGERIHIEFTATLLSGPGGVELVGAVIRDVTARRNEERSLRERLKAAEGGG